MSGETHFFPIPFPVDASIQVQGITVPGSAGEGHTPIYVSAAFPHLPNCDSDPRFPKTVYEAFNLGLKYSGNKNCLGKREWDNKLNDFAKEYTWENYNSVDEKRTKIGSGLLHLVEQGLFGQGQERTGWSVGIWSGNRPEWQHVNQACAAYSLVLVSLYDTLGPNVVEYCCQHSETKVIFATPNHIPELLKLSKSIPQVKLIVSIDALGKGGEVLKAWGEEKGIQIMDLEEYPTDYCTISKTLVSILGAANLTAHVPPHRKSVASICYTSGTTGMPKGAILTHEALASTVVTHLHGSNPGSMSVFFSYLPLSHIYERFCEDVALAAGESIGYSCGDNLRLLEDMAILKPTFFVSVPRVLNRIYQALKAGTVDAEGWKGALMRKAYADKLHNLKTKGVFVHPVWDRIAFKKVRAVLGGNIKYIGSGSAPINPDVLDFLKIVFSTEVMEGYGSTENCGTAVKCWADDHWPAGTVGPALPGVEIRLVDVPDMNYFSTDKPVPRGELCTRGMMVIPGYYKDAAKTAETIDSEGWLHTGDIASVDEVGRFKIIDRIKNLVKLSQGEYVAVEKVENVYALCPLIAQIYVHADSLEDHVVGVVIPDPLKLAPLASKALGRHISATNVKELQSILNDPKVVAAVGAELAPYAERARLNGYEKINNDIHLSLDLMTMENDMLTPTFKVKRNVTSKVYEVQLRELYDRKVKKVVRATKL